MHLSQLKRGRGKDLMKVSYVSPNTGDYLLSICIHHFFAFLKNSVWFQLDLGLNSTVLKAYS